MISSVFRRGLFVSLMVFGIAAPQAALADCTNPAGITGEIIYNSTVAMLQFCNGTNWINAAGSSTGGGPEVDPEVGTLTPSKWCQAGPGGTEIVCTADPPADNLGDHTATQDVDAGGFKLKEAGSLVLKTVMGGPGVSGSATLPGLADVQDVLNPADGEVLTYVSASGEWQATAPAGGGGGIGGFQVITSTSDFTVPAGISKIKAHVIGGGGGGGGCYGVGSDGGNSTFNGMTGNGGQGGAKSTTQCSLGNTKNGNGGGGSGGDGGLTGQNGGKVDTVGGDGGVAAGPYGGFGGRGSNNGNNSAAVGSSYGAGGGAGTEAGGGGGGGWRYGVFTVTPGQVITCTVGSGGAGATNVGGYAGAAGANGACIIEW